MDLDDLDEPTPKPTVRKFLPKPKGKPPQKKDPATVVKSEPVKAEPKELVDENLGTEEDRSVVSVGLETGGASGLNGNGAAASVMPGAEAEDVQNDSMEVDDGDYVVREIDVFFNPQADENTQMYLMQYPLRPSWRPYDLEQSCKEIRVKPKSAKVEMDIEVDVDSRSHHERFHSLDTITKTLTSSGNILPKTGYAFGVLKGNKLYLNPVHAVVQLRPSNNADDDEEEEREDTDGAKTLEDFDRKQATASSKKQGKMIPSSTQTTNDKESWVPLKYHGTNSEASASCLRKLMVANHSPVPATLSSNDYLNSFCPRRRNNGMRQAGLCMRSLLSLPLEERLNKWLCEGGEPAYRFSVLKYLAPELPAENVIEILKQHAVLVQGLWVPNNSIVLPDCTENKALARNYLLLKFSKNLTIHDEELKFGRDMSSVLNEVLNKLAIRRTKMNDWKFRASEDPSFAKLYPSVALQQRQLWKERELDIMTKMNVFRPQFQRTGNLAPVKKISVPTEKREALLKALEVLFKNHSVNSLETICRGLRDMAVSASSLQRAGDNKWMVVAASCVDSRGELEGVIEEFATCINGVYVAKSSSMHPELNPLRKVVIRLFLAAPPNAKLKKALILEAFKAEFQKEVPINDYQKVMTELCNSNGSAWMLKSPGGR